MGTVYLAEQCEPIRRRVALKVIKLGMDTSQVLARFVNERQALAIMDHPNIARIFDAGSTRKGRPYFVMEYIEGIPITQYCDRKRMEVGQRLELFLTVCSAVHHAHQKGVIHRDLKPSNVLVVEGEGAPVPKVIDFGIAKATDQWAVENTLLTQFGQMVGTPEYASPEQAEVMTGNVDETSDVYSLGVLLYELLIGTVPFDSARMRQVGLSEMLRIIREEDAPALSRKLAAMDTAAADDIAAHRQTDAASLRRSVGGDLSWIAAKALEKVRERRYSSVAELAADIQRYLEHLPVLASPPSRIYRTRKYVRRHRTAALGVAAGLVFLALGAVTVWSLVRHDSPSRPKLAQKGTIVLGDFANTTGDAAFNGIRQVLAVELGKSPDFSLLSDARVSRMLGLMVRAPDTKLTPDVASEICERTAGTAMVEGSITGLGNGYVLSLRARNCRTGEVLDEEQAPAAKKEEVFPALGQMANHFRTRAESLPTVPKEPTLGDQATTSSLEAWRFYSAAMKAQQAKAQTTEAVHLFTRAIEIDPQFAMAYAHLGRLYATLGESELGAKNIAKAYELRNRVSDRENYEITFNYHRQITRNLEVARQTLESWAQKYPGERGPHGFLGAFTTQGSGRYEKAVEEGQKAIGLDPDYSIGYQNVTFANIYQNKLPEAEATLRQASQRKIEVNELSICRYFIAFLRRDQGQWTGKSPNARQNSKPRDCLSTRKL
jgi:serine/threonine protein kinase/tetratricopeptide (TPR) repeat protein